MKKGIILTSLLLAGMILLAHSIVPHHHHDMVAVALLNVFHPSKNDTDRFANTHQNEHKGQHTDHNAHKISEDCLLKNIYVKGNKDQQTALDNSSFSLYPYLVLFCLSTPPILNENSVDLFCRRKPYSVSYHIMFISQATGLRAPPF